jgi:Predicted membrane protein
MNPYLYPLLYIGIVAAIFVVVYVFVILSGRYYRDLYNELANSSGISEFRDAAKWTWLGTLLFIVIVGAILALVGRIFALLGYNRLKEWNPPQQT